MDKLFPNVFMHRHIFKMVAFSLLHRINLILPNWQHHFGQPLLSLGSSVPCFQWILIPRTLSLICQYHSYGTGLPEVVSGTSSQILQFSCFCWQHFQFSCAILSILNWQEDCVILVYVFGASLVPRPLFFLSNLIWAGEGKKRPGIHCMGDSAHAPQHYPDFG